MSQENPLPEMPCMGKGRGGPCWGPVRIVDQQDTESQHMTYYACEGHMLVVLYGYADMYKPQPKEKP